MIENSGRRSSIPENRFRADAGGCGPGKPDPRIGTIRALYFYWLLWGLPGINTWPSGPSRECQARPSVKDSLERIYAG